MHCLNEYIARTSNIEDQCTGRFWEGRFKSQALLDEEVLLTVMAYVDLDPVRAGIAYSMEASEFNSGQQQLGDITDLSRSAETAKPALFPFAQAFREGEDQGLPVNLQDDLDLLDSTGRVVHPKKRESIPDTCRRSCNSAG